MGASSHRSSASDRGRGRRCEESPLMGTTEVELARRGTFGAPSCWPPRRSGVVRGPFSRKPPPTFAPHLSTWFAGARRAVWDMDDSSLGVRSPSASRVRAIVVYRFASPIPSALRVFHPRSGLIPPGPRGSVSRHFRPWGLVMAYRAFPTQPAVAPLDARCSLAVSASFGFQRALASSTSASAPAFRCPSRPIAPRSPPRLLTAQPCQPATASARASPPPKWLLTRASGRNRWQGIEHGARFEARTVPERPLGAASGRLEPATSERCSD
jgi:hypothetical protein